MSDVGFLRIKYALKNIARGDDFKSVKLLRPAFLFTIEMMCGSRGYWEL